MDGRQLKSGTRDSLTNSRSGALLSVSIVPPWHRIRVFVPSLLQLPILQVKVLLSIPVTNYCESSFTISAGEFTSPSHVPE
jgi:hypothetical protein